MTTTTEDTATATSTSTAADQYDTRPLRRSTDDRMLAGVAGGIARYLDVDATLVRVGIAALTLLTGVGAALYIAAWLLIPADGEDQSVAAAWIADRQNRVR
jgi:phage shock protein PspC (stress-responsive transcriptional regulator)